MDQQVLMNLTDLEQVMHDVQSNEVGKRHVCAFFAEGLKKFNGQTARTNATQIEVLRYYLSTFVQRVESYQADVENNWQRLWRYRK